MKKLLLLLALTVALPIAALAQGNTWQEATILNSGTTASGTMDSKDADDWYKIELPKDGNVTFDVSTDGDLLVRYVQLYYLSDEGKIKEGEYGYVYKDDGVRSFTCNALLSNPYYVRVHREKGEGNYFMKYTYTPNRYGNDTEPNDEWKTAQKIEVGQTVQGHLGFWKMEKNYLYGWKILDGDDYYKIEVPTEGSITLDLKCEETLDVSLLEVKFPEPSNGTPLLRTNMNPSKVQGPLVSEDVLPGTYYVHVHRNSDTGSYGGYTLKYTHKPYNCDPEPNNDYEHAIEIKDGETIRGHFGSMLGQPNTSGNYRDGEDWYKVTVTDGGQTLLSFLPEQAQVMPRYSYNFYIMENGELKSIKNGEAGGQRVILQTPDGQNGTYYLKLNGYFNPGYYTLECGKLQLSADSKIRLSYTGRNSVRIGIPSDYTLTIENLDSKPSPNFFLVIPCTDDIKLLGATLPGKNGYKEYLPMDSIGIEDDNVMWFVVPSMDPFERYSFTIKAEGRINNVNSSRRRIEPVTTSLLVFGGLVLVNTAIDYASDEVMGFCYDVINETVDLQEGKELDFYVETYGRDKLKTEIYEEWSKNKGNTGVAIVAGKRAVKTIATQALDKIPGGKIINFAGELLETTWALGKALNRRLWYTLYKDVADYKGWEKRWEAKHLDMKTIAYQKVRSWDPNEMVGPVGVGDENYIGETRTIDYRILFENKKEATAPAYRIRISDVLDENVFDVNSVRFGETSHEGVGYDWKMTREGNRLSWDIEGIELPPNVNAPEGEGYVSFSVDLKPGLKSGTQLKNKAAIIFDYNETIETNEYVNTLDLVAPEATILSHSVGAADTVTVRCTGSDAGSGISHYVFYGSVDGGEYGYMGESFEPEFSFKQDPKTVVDLKVYAVDNVSNMQAASTQAYTVGIEGITYAPAATNGWAIFRLNGTTVATGQGVPNVQLPAGIYIVREGGNARKIVVE